MQEKELNSVFRKTLFYLPQPQWVQKVIDTSQM